VSAVDHLKETQQTKRIDKCNVVYKGEKDEKSMD
jgi:hypothetical protein